MEAHSDGPGKGSEFTIRLPLTAVSSQATRECKGPSTLLSSPTSQRVLVVDDNRDAARKSRDATAVCGRERSSDLQRR